MKKNLENSRQIEEIKFFNHKYVLNMRAISKKQRAEMREKKQRSLGTSENPWSGYANDLLL